MLYEYTKHVHERVDLDVDVVEEMVVERDRETKGKQKRIDNIRGIEKQQRIRQETRTEEKTRAKERQYCGTKETSG